MAAELTPDDVGDVSAVPDLLAQIDSPVVSFAADGAYDAEAVYDAVTERDPGSTVIIPPRATAVVDQLATSQRDLNIAMIAQHGRIGWQHRSGYGRRSLVETAVYRYKAIVGRRLRARSLLNQRTKAKIGCNVLNRMTRLGMPVTVRTR